MFRRVIFFFLIVSMISLFSGCHLLGVGDRSKTSDDAEEIVEAEDIVEGTVLEDEPELEAIEDEVEIEDVDTGGSGSAIPARLVIGSRQGSINQGSSMTISAALNDYSKELGDSVEWFSQADPSMIVEIREIAQTETTSYNEYKVVVIVEGDEVGDYSLKIGVRVGDEVLVEESVDVHVKSLTSSVPDQSEEFSVKTEVAPLTAVSVMTDVAAGETAKPSEQEEILPLQVIVLEQNVQEQYKGQDIEVLSRNANLDGDYPIWGLNDHLLPTIPGEGDDANIYLVNELEYAKDVKRGTLYLARIQVIGGEPPYKLSIIKPSEVNSMQYLPIEDDPVFANFKDQDGEHIINIAIRFPQISEPDEFSVTYIVTDGKYRAINTRVNYNVSKCRYRDVSSSPFKVYARFEGSLYDVDKAILELKTSQKGKVIAKAEKDGIGRKEAFEFDNYSPTFGEHVCLEDIQAFEFNRIKKPNFSISSMSSNNGLDISKEPSIIRMLLVSCNTSKEFDDFETDGIETDTCLFAEWQGHKLWGWDSLNSNTTERMCDTFMCSPVWHRGNAFIFGEDVVYPHENRWNSMIHIPIYNKRSHKKQNFFQKHQVAICLASIAGCVLTF